MVAKSSASIAATASAAIKPGGGKEGGEKSMIEWEINQVNVARDRFVTSLFGCVHKKARTFTRMYRRSCDQFWQSATLIQITTLCIYPVFPRIPKAKHF